MRTMDNVVEVSGLVKRRGSFVVGPLDLAVARGFVTGVVGANGAGKTTLLRTLVGLVHADQGTIQLPSPDRVGVAFDQPFVLPDWRVRDAAATYAQFREGWDGALFDRLCRRFGLSADAKVKDLSRGQGSVMMTALALAEGPELLILDEPTSGLDPSARADLIDVLRDYMTGPEASLVFSTHITSDLENFADHLLFIDEGTVVYAGPTDELTTEFAYVRGMLEDVTAENAALVRGLRRGRDTFDGIIRTTDTAAFGPSVQIEAPTIEQVVVHHQRHQPQEV